MSNISAILDSFTDDSMDRKTSIKSIKPCKTLKLNRVVKPNFNLNGGEHGVTYGSGTGGSSYGGGFGWGV